MKVARVVISPASFPECDKKEWLLSIILVWNSAGKTCRIMDEESRGGFSFLFSKLCELSFNNEANKGWDVYRRPRYTDRRREALKLCLYETLFEELRAPWVGELRRTQNKLNQDENCSFGVFDKLSITAFKFRLARRFDDADQLEHLVCKWRNLDGR